ncbi:MAG: hypothetical protein SGPRY_006021 [Prymnesium sp.]
MAVGNIGNLVEAPLQNLPGSPPSAMHPLPAPTRSSSLVLSKPAASSAPDSRPQLLGTPSMTAMSPTEI